MPRFHVAGTEVNLSRLQRDVQEAAGLGCDIAMFPEMFLTGYQGENRPSDFRRMFAELSAKNPRMLMVFGCISEGGRNRLLVFEDGRETARYDKVHLFEPNGEHEMWEPGDSYSAVTFKGLKIGLATCNDVRFPEQSRALKLKHNISILLYPALWPWERDHIWATLLRARAIENGIFCAGCCISSIENGRERFDGAGNHAFDPLGNIIYPRGRVYDLEISRIDDVLVNTVEQHREITDTKLYD